MNFSKNLRKCNSKRRSIKDGMFVYTIKRKPAYDGCSETDAYVDGERRLGARLCVIVIQESVSTNGASHTSQLQGLRVLLSVIPYRKWNFRATDVSRAFLKSESLGRIVYMQPL